MSERIDPSRLDWSKGGGLLPAIVQDCDSAAVLMLGYMNEAALAETLRLGRIVFYSRSRRRLWMKGETSGNVLKLVGVHADCDADTLLLQARPSGPVCHLGTASCFASASPPPTAFLRRLEAIIDARLERSPPGSYTAALAAEGTMRVAQKVGEEGVELALAGAGTDRGAVIAEAADLLFHTLLLLRMHGSRLADVAAELESRHR